MNRYTAVEAVPRLCAGHGEVGWGIVGHFASPDVAVDAHIRAVNPPHQSGKLRFLVLVVARVSGKLRFSRSEFARPNLSQMGAIFRRRSLFRGGRLSYLRRIRRLRASLIILEFAPGW